MNHGEVPQYYVEDHHEGIIDAETFDLVQAEFKRRQGNKTSYSGISKFSSKVICGECGCCYGSKVWHSTDKNRKTVWRCNRKYKKDGRPKCDTPHLSEDEIKSCFIKAVNKLIAGKDSIIEDMETLRAAAADTNGAESEMVGIKAEIESLTDKIQSLIDRNARVAQDQAEYEIRYRELMERYEERKKRYSELAEQIDKAHAADKTIGHFIELQSKKKKPVTEFDENLWGGMAQGMTINLDGKL